MDQNEPDRLKLDADPELLQLEIGRLRAVVSALSDVVHGLSHDLREPIRLVNIYAQFLRTRTSIEDDPNGKEYLHEISSAAQRLDALVNGILEYARLIGADAPPFQPVDMNAVLQSALANLQMQIEQNRATITSDDLPEVSGDSAQLTQLMQNLISNAIKYRGSAAPEVFVTAERTSSEWRFSVQDNGIGINEDYLNQLFVPFSRLHGREISGVGLGLAICRSIVERHGGRIWVASRVGKGSTFMFELPSAARPPEPLALEREHRTVVQ